MTLTINYNNIEYKCTIRDTSIQIKNSYRCTSKSDMKCILSILYNKFSNHIIFKRSIPSLIREWRAHNLLYEMALYEGRVRDVDFEYPVKWYYSLGYWILSILYGNNN